MMLTGLLFLLLGGFTFSSEQSHDQRGLNQTADPEEGFSSSSGLPDDQQGLIQTTLTQAEDCFPCNGVYRGRRNTTESGYTCQRWDSQESHSHNYTPSAYALHHLEENYCRNPDGDTKPWCYTTNSSVEKDYCSIPPCKPKSPTINSKNCMTGRGEDYRGTISVTWSGKTCKMWSAVGHFKDLYHCNGLEENYCRNPDNDTKPWCLTVDSSSYWEYCNVPICEEEDLEPNCTEQDLLNSLNLNKKDRLTMGRPVRHHKKPVKVHLKMEIYAVLDVSEIEQTLYLHMWTHTGWNNHHVKWNEREFCNLSRVNVPAQSLWKPDIIISEQIERSKNSPSPYVTIWSHGAVSWLNEEVVVTNCKMRVYRFPFDTQSCSITFKSQSYNSDQLKIADDQDDQLKIADDQNKTKVSVQTQHEWMFKNITVSKGTTENSKKQTLVFTITMQRWSALYIANFLMPILFFLSLDLASFLISDTGGEKLSFKITVLLAVTVMQLLLNEILPGSSDKIPLIAIFCVGIFTLMLLSVLETIVVMNLIDRDASPQEKETEQRLKKKRETKVCCFSSSDCDEAAEGTPFVFSKFFRDQQTDESINLKTVLEELKEVLLDHRKEEKKEGCWTKMAKRINRVFMMLYFPAVALFLLTMFSLWTSDG